MKIDKSLSPFYNYLNNYNPNNKKYFYLLKYIFDKKIYYYGNNFNNPDEKDLAIKVKIKNKIFDFLMDLYVRIYSLFQKPSDKKVIWNSSYFNISKTIENNKFQISRMPWNYSRKEYNFYNFELYKKIKKINQKLIYGNFNELISNNFFKEIDLIKEEITNFVIKEDIRAIFLANDVGFFEKLSIEIFKELKRPSFLFIHGLPGIYGTIDNNRTDYLVVWGEAIKQNYVNAGVSSDKILISGHPNYKIKSNVTLKFNFDDILVLPKSMNGCPAGDNYTLRERGNCIYYMSMIQQILEKLGVKKARFRPHPGEDKNWYLKFIDSNFYSSDNDNLFTSLNKSTLVIGSTSTVFLESILSGVNYVAFEPRLENNNTFDNLPAAAPFNGNDDRFPVAQNMEELFDLLNNKKLVDTSILNDYINPNFDSSIFLDKIN